MKDTTYYLDDTNEIKHIYKAEPGKLILEDFASDTGAWDIHYFSHPAKRDAYIEKDEYLEVTKESAMDIVKGWFNDTLRKVYF